MIIILFMKLLCVDREQSIFIKTHEILSASVSSRKGMLKLSCEKHLIYGLESRHTPNHTHCSYLLAHNSVDSGTVPDVVLGHHSGPLLFSEQHKGVQWLFDVRLGFLLLAELLSQTVKKNKRTELHRYMNTAYDRPK